MAFKLGRSSMGSSGGSHQNSVGQSHQTGTYSTAHPPAAAGLGTSHKAAKIKAPKVPHKGHKGHHKGHSHHPKAGEAKNYGQEIKAKDYSKGKPRGFQNPKVRAAAQAARMARAMVSKHG